MNLHPGVHFWEGVRGGRLSPPPILFRDVVGLFSRVSLLVSHFFIVLLKSL